MTSDTVATNKGNSNLIGDRLREVWEKSGIKQEEFALSVGVSVPSLINYFKNRVSPNSEFILKIIEKYSVSPNWLFLGREIFQECTGSSLLDVPQHPNTDILEQVIAGVESALKRKRATLDPGKKAELIVLLYEHFVNEKNINQDTVERYLRLAS